MLPKQLRVTAFASSSAQLTGTIYKEKNKEGINNVKEKN
jgi:hypothetical protein